MSFGANQARLMLLISMQYDIDLQVQFLTQHKLFLAKQSGQMMNLKVEYEPGSQPDKVLQARIYQLSEAEKIIDLKINNLDKRRQAIAQERENLNQMVSKNIQASFKNGYS